jgi:peroxiredoxin
MADAAARRAEVPARAFALRDTAGGTVDLAALWASKPVLLYFIDGECPCSRDAAPFMDRLRDAYGDALAVVGVINVDGDEAQSWAKSAGVRFPVVADPKCAVIDAYGAERSVYMTLVSPGGTVAKTYPGYSASTLAEIAAGVARMAGVPDRAPRFEGAPEKLRVGCPLRTEVARPTSAAPADPR